ncbi:MAG: hypothetical protein JXA68_04875 [Ignavibacteriales bacterium]|nr:hypothetical protein [Ignavibacteriales bacterium]
MLTLKKIHSILLILFFSCNCLFCQETPTNRFELGLLDVYILEFKVDTTITKMKFKSCKPIKNSKKVLCKIKVDTVLYNTDTITYLDNELIKVDYALFDKKIINKNKLIGSFYNSDNKKCLIFNKIISIDTNKRTYYKQHAFLTGLMNCNKKNKIEKAINNFENK